MREDHEFAWLWFGFILAAFMMVSLNVWGCVCRELAAPVPKAMEGREEYVNNRTDVVIFDKEGNNGN